MNEMKEALFHHKPLIEYDPISEAAMEIKALAADMSGEEYSKPRFASIKRKLNKIRERIG